MTLTASVGPSALWYTTRGTGAVALVLLTISVVLGVADLRGVQSERVPRFVIDSVHRSASLLAVAFLAVHILTSVLDPFAPIRLIDVVVPFVSAYRPVWLGLGAVASDLLIAVALTSVLRRQFGRRAWRATHWLAYACWPIAVVHGLGTGSDANTAWLLALTAGSVLVVLGAVWVRIASGWPNDLGPRIAAASASVASVIALLIWLPTGPLASGWAKRAGTPSTLLANAATAAGTIHYSGNANAGVRTPAAFSASATGTAVQSQLANGMVKIDLRVALSGRDLGTLEIKLYGQPIEGGGVAMSSSAVTLGTAAIPALYSGTVTSLSGTNIEASVRGTPGAMLLLARLQIDQNTGTITGNVTTQPG